MDIHPDNSHRRDSCSEGCRAERILLLHSYGSDFSPFSEFAQSFRAELDRQFKEPVDVYEFSLASACFSNENLDLDRPFAEYLRTLFSTITNWTLL